MNKVITKPLSSYDIVGFLIPGIFAWVLIFIAASQLGLINANLFCSEPFRSFLEAKPGSIGQILATVIVASFIILISYITGHLIGILSAQCIEKTLFLLITKHKYPCSYLISKKESESTLCEKCINKSEFPWNRRWFFFISEYLIRLIAKVLVQPSLKDKDTNQLDCIDQVCRIGPLELSDKLLKKIDKAIKKDDDFHVIRHMIMKDNEHLASKVESYHALYCLKRSLTYQLILFAWFELMYYFIITLKAMCACFDLSVLIWNIISMLLIPLLCFLLSSIFFIGFCKYYRKVTREILVAYVAYSMQSKS